MESRENQILLSSRQCFIRLRDKVCFKIYYHRIKIRLFHTNIKPSRLDNMADSLETKKVMKQEDLSGWMSPFLKRVRKSGLW